MRNKNSLYTMKVETTELRKWQLFAKSKDSHLSDIIKGLMRGEELPEFVEVKKKPRRKYSNVDPRLIRAINAIGNNLNQISRGVNSHEKLDILTQLNRIEKQLDRVIDAC